ncbi:MAG: ATP-binding cassette domain-containing protein [Verrucomicrobia bacterium]|nr:ATP-binding cassette domain-containing protein [Verrucomicrobiota bacterium]MBM4087735.1 ATP-binding cassette domain-containing protein [Planctomycetota bacterium]
MIRVENFSIMQGAFRLRDISFSVPTGRYAVLMGRTGCGKTTVLEAVCGLRRPATGRIELMGRDVTAEKPGSRGIGYVPQDLALFPTLTVREHIAFALEIRKCEQREIELRVRQLADLLGIGHLLARRPVGLSGGESQRVALGRALSAAPPVLCLDEPLSALDEATREEMFALLERVRRETGVTILHVTHSLMEAKRLADIILHLRDNKITEEVMRP